MHLAAYFGLIAVSTFSLFCFSLFPLSLFTLSVPLAHAQQVVTSTSAESLSVTIYRSTPYTISAVASDDYNEEVSGAVGGGVDQDLDLETGNGNAIDLDNLQGYALITETRLIDLPAGDVTLRFEGVAGGIIPASAVIMGLPGGVTQKNQDATLLTPAALVDGNLGRVVSLTRTNKATGKVTQETAKLISGLQGGVILQTKAGYEALGCAGLPESLSYAALPTGLTARPTLSVNTRSASAGRAKITLSYLSHGFDWSADYVVHIAPDGKKLSLFAWLTLANGNAESFPNAQTQAVAGKINAEETEGSAEETEGSNERMGNFNAYDAPLHLKCWPSDITSTHPAIALPPAQAPDMDEQAAVLPSLSAQPRDMMEESIIVSGTRIAMAARQEALGDLKLYRIPEPVTVNANAQKQVAMIQQNDVPFELIYATQIDADYTYDDKKLTRIIRMQNRKEAGLGLPLPSGRVAIFEPALASLELGQPMLVSTNASLDDTPVGQKVELQGGKSDTVKIGIEESQTENGNEHKSHYTMTVTNENPHPVMAEVMLIHDKDQTSIIKPSMKLLNAGWPTWRVRVAANSSATLKYTIQKKR